MVTQQEIHAILARNNRVEADKAWETSWARMVLVALFTYLAIALYLNAIHIERPWLNSVVPTVGFMLSTLTLPYFKKSWLRWIYKK